MRTTALPYEVEILIRKDFHAVQKKIEDLLIAGRPNRPVVTPNYLTPRVEESSELPRSDERGEYHHYRKVRSVIEYIFEHEGRIKEKYRDMLMQIHAPSYVMALIA